MLNVDYITLSGIVENIFLVSIEEDSNLLGLLCRYILILLAV